MAAHESRYLLDANLSPKVGRFLTREIGLDVISLHGQGGEQMPDTAVVDMARGLGRVIITLDRDFIGDLQRSPRFSGGVIYLDLPNSLRTIPEINRILASFFQTDADAIDLDRVTVVITEHRTRIITHE